MFAAALSAVPAAAQQQAPITRAQVKAELAALVAAGYNPGDWMNYPDNIQAAEARVQAQRAARAPVSGRPMPQTPGVDRSDKQ
jgi:hypothetical protein